MAATVLVLAVAVVVTLDARVQEAASPPAPAGVPRTTGGGAVTLEAHDPALGAALLRLAGSRTAKHLDAVGDRYYDLGIRDKALEYYLEALRRDRTSVGALDGAARIYRDWGQLTHALGNAHRATYFAPRSAAAWNTLGTILQALDLQSDAAHAYRFALSLDRTAVYARSNLCYLALTTGDSNTALDECRAALAVDEAFTPARNNLGLLFAVAGDRGRAAETFRAATGEAAGHYNTGLVLLAQQDYAAAILAFEAAYRADPQLAPAHRFARAARRALRQ